ncbi:unnamed protein product [Amoebophrya sp. A120]|nr:unnamed protein product [Amoebophrya sp. A120]|eukprot:GSA120T00023077001.1
MPVPHDKTPDHGCRAPRNDEREKKEANAAEHSSAPTYYTPPKIVLLGDVAAEPVGQKLHLFAQIRERKYGAVYDVTDRKAKCLIEIPRCLGTFQPGDEVRVFCEKTSDSLLTATNVTRVSGIGYSTLALWLNASRGRAEGP